MSSANVRMNCEEGIVDTRAAERLHRGWGTQRACAWLVSALMVVAASGQAVAAPVDDAAMDVARQFAAKLGAPMPFRTVAVLPIAGDDDHTLELALIDALKRGSTANGKDVTVVDRTNLDHVIEELGRQGRVEFDEKTAARVGELLNAEAIVFGSIEAQRGNPLFAEMRALLKVDRVEQGVILDAGAFSASAVSTAGMAAAAVAIVLMTTITVVAGLRAFGRKQKTRRAAGDKEAVARLLVPVVQAKTLLQQAQANLLASQQASAAEAVRGVERAVLDLAQRIEQAPLPDLSRSGKDVKAALRFDEALFEPLAKLASAARELLDAASDAGNGAPNDRVRAKADEARSLVTELTTRLQGREQHLR